MKNDLELAEEYALDLWLRGYPDDMTYTKALHLLNKDQWSKPDSEWRKVITPWEVAEHCTGEQIASFMIDTCNDIKRLLSRPQ